MLTFRQKVLQITREIPKGSTLTYKEVAARAGNILGARAVGNILNKNYDPQIPCHRVIRSDGKTGGYNRGAEAKIALLREEGAIIKDPRGRAPRYYRSSLCSHDMPQGA